MNAYVIRTFVQSFIRAYSLVNAMEAETDFSGQLEALTNETDRLHQIVKYLLNAFIKAYIKAAKRFD